MSSHQGECAATDSSSACETVDPRHAARLFAFYNRMDLARELVSWWWSDGVLVENAKFHKLAALCREYISEAEAHAEAERLITKIVILGLGVETKGSIEAFETFVRTHCSMPAHVPVNYESEWTKAALEGWNAHAKHMGALQ